MKVLIIGAKGNLGSRIVKKAKQRGHDITACLKDGETFEEGNALNANLFDLTQKDIKRFDAVLSAFGSGINADPSLNQKACDKLIELGQNSDVHILHIIGSGSLYEDATHTGRVYEAADHPDVLRPISAWALKGMEDFKNSHKVKWTVVCPSKTFDRDRAGTGHYEVGTDENLLYNDSGESFTTYDDVADAMLDFAEEGSHIGQVCTILSVNV